MHQNLVKIVLFLFISVSYCNTVSLLLHFYAIVLHSVPSRSGQFHLASQQQVLIYRKILTLWWNALMKIAH